MIQGLQCVTEEYWDSLDLFGAHGLGSFRSAMLAASGFGDL